MPSYASHAADRIISFPLTYSGPPPSFKLESFVRFNFSGPLGCSTVFDTACTCQQDNGCQNDYLKLFSREHISFTIEFYSDLVHVILEAHAFITNNVVVQLRHIIFDEDFLPEHQRALPQHLIFVVLFHDEPFAFFCLVHLEGLRDVFIYSLSCLQTQPRSYPSNHPVMPILASWKEMLDNQRCRPYTSFTFLDISCYLSCACPPP